MEKPPDKPRSGAAGIIFAVLRIIAALICAFLLYTFIFTMSLDQINHGNVIGTIYCTAVILLVILYPLMKKKKPLRITAKVCGAGLLAFAVYCGVISCFIVSEMRHGEDAAIAASTANGGTPQTVIVLGCKTVDGYPSQMLKLRLDKAVEYINRNPDTVCIVTGGQGGDEIEPEAVSMQRYLVQHGIPADKIITEPLSVNTEENIRHSSEIIAERGLPHNVVIVSECYHIYRGVRHARKAGFEASGIYPDPATVLRTMPSYWLREIFAITRDYIFY